MSALGRLTSKTLVLTEIPHKNVSVRNAGERCLNVKMPNSVLTRFYHLSSSSTQFDHPYLLVFGMRMNSLEPGRTVDAVIFSPSAVQYPKIHHLVLEARAEYTILSFHTWINYTSS